MLAASSASADSWQALQAAFKDNEQDKSKPLQVQMNVLKYESARIQADTVAVRRQSMSSANDVANVRHLLRVC